MVEYGKGNHFCLECSGFGLITLTLVHEYPVLSEFWLMEIQCSEGIQTYKNTKSPVLTLRGKRYLLKFFSYASQIPKEH